jgi:hypothetical protein
MEFSLPTYDFNQELVLEALGRSGPFWFDDLAPHLAKSCWLKLREEYGLNESNYGTVRVIDRSLKSNRNVIGCIENPFCGFSKRIVIESLEDHVAARYRDLGLDFVLPKEIENSALFRNLGRALNTIAVVRGAAVAVSAVLSVIHILKPEAPQYDVSFSDPTLPFSVFVGVHPESDVIQDLRLAESILHECMHLQLTLIESQTRLLDAENELHLSPWRQTLRPTRGILHALYVFRVIQDFFRALLSSAPLTSAERAHIQSRLSDIEAEVDQLGDFSASNDLTPIGRALAKRLLVRN